MPALVGEWTPPSLSAGNLPELSAALRRHEAVAVMHGPGMGGMTWQKRLNDFVRTLSPQTAVLAQASGDRVLGELMRLRGELPIQQQVTPDGGRDIFGRPTYVVENIALNTTWLDNPQRMAGAGAVLVLGEADLALGEWRQLRSASVGGCEAPMQALAQGQTAIREQMQPFVLHADSALANNYRSELARRLPAISRKLNPFRRDVERHQFDGNSQWEVHQCGQAYVEWLAPFEQCVAGGECPMAPRVVVDAVGVAIASAEPSTYVPATCSDQFPLDVTGEVRAVARDVALPVSRELDRGWLAFADRLAAAAAVEDTLEQICTPVRRRLDATAIGTARQQLATIGQQLAAPVAPGVGPEGSSGEWIVQEAPFRAPGVGAIQQLLRWQRGPDADSTRIAAAAVELRDTIAQQNQCLAGNDQRPLVAALVDVGSSKVEFMGFFFAEELFCNDLPPLL